MGIKTNIAWTDATWNIARGCSKVDDDCKYCYMYRESFNKTRYNPYQVIKTKTVFNLPLKLKQPSKIFVSSLTDVFHPDCDSFRDEMWDIIRKRPDHTYQILTKRPERIHGHLPKDIRLMRNVWLGTSVGSTKSIYRISLLGELDTNNLLFLSFEPLYGQLEFVLPQSIRWIIVGGESGNETGKYRYRPCKLKWIEHIADYSDYRGIPLFIKQLGTHLAKDLKLKDRHGADINEFPKDLQIREFPNINTERINNG